MKHFVVIHRESADSAAVVRWFDCGELALAAFLEASQAVTVRKWHCAVSASSDGGINHFIGIRYHQARELVRAAIAEQVLSTP